MIKVGLLIISPLAQAVDELRDHESVRRILRQNGIPTNTSQFNFRSFTAEEVSKALGNLDLHKSIGHGKIPLWVLKIGSQELSPSLTIQQVHSKVLLA